MSGSQNSKNLICRFPTEKDLSTETIEHLASLINRVYDEAESGMWKSKGTRTTPAQVEELLEKKALLLTEIKDSIVGSVNINLMDNGIAEFGMLVADSNHRGIGIGSSLVRAAEKWAKEKNCNTMRLELLTPRNWEHPSKKFLKTWYSKIGYIPQFSEPFENLHPEKIPELATDCDFTVWHKAL